MPRFQIDIYRADNEVQIFIDGNFYFGVLNLYENPPFVRDFSDKILSSESEHEISIIGINWPSKEDGDRGNPYHFQYAILADYGNSRQVFGYDEVRGPNFPERALNLAKICMNHLYKVRYEQATKKLFVKTYINGNEAVHEYTLDDTIQRNAAFRVNEPKLATA